MTTRPTLLSTPDDAALAKWTRDVEGFVEDLIGTATLPSAPEEVKVVSQSNSVKVTFRAVNEVGVSEYKIYRSTDKNFSGENAEHIATVTQAIDPSSTDLIYIDAESTEKSYYFVSAVKGIRRPRLEGIPAGFGSATGGAEIGEDENGGTISGFSGIPGSILFVNEDSLIDQDNENLFYSQTFRAMVVGRAGLLWGSQKSPDVTLIRDDADTLALRRGTNAQMFNIYNTFTDATDNELAEIGFIPVADVFVIGTKKGSAGGTARPMAFRTDEIEAMTIGIDQKSTFLESVLIDGATDSVQLLVRGHSTQTSDIFLVEDDANAKRFSVENGGLARVEGTFGIAFNPNQLGGFVGPSISFGAPGFTPTIPILGVVGTVTLLIGETLARIDIDGSGQAASWSATQHIIFTPSTIWSQTNAPGVSNAATSKTNPVFIPDRSDFNTGIGGGVGDGSVSIINLSRENTTWTEHGSAPFSMEHKHLFISDGSEIFAALHKLSGTLTGLLGNTGTLFGHDIDPTIVTQSETESIANIASLNIEEPKITDNLTGGGLITVASTVRIGGAPDEGVTNWALNVVTGATNLGGGLNVTGVFSVTNNITNQAITQIRTAEATVVTSSGSSVTASNLIPAGSFVIGLTTRVTTLVTGPAGYDVGDGADVDRWGNSILVAEDTTSDITDFQSSALTLFPAANDVVITSDGVDFTAGEILITVHYMTLVAPIA